MSKPSQLVLKNGTPFYLWLKKKKINAAVNTLSARWCCLDIKEARVLHRSIKGVCDFGAVPPDE